MPSVLLELLCPFQLEPVLLLGHLDVEGEVEDRSDPGELVQFCIIMKGGDEVVEWKRGNERSKRATFSHSRKNDVGKKERKKGERTLTALVHARKDERFAPSFPNGLDERDKALPLVRLARPAKPPRQEVSVQNHLISYSEEAKRTTRSPK